MSTWKILQQYIIHKYCFLVFSNTMYICNTNYVLRYILADGTLLGSYLFHDMIPWDDDMDLMVDYRDYPKVKDIFSNITIWLKYNLVGYHDARNEYEFSELKTIYLDEPMNKLKQVENPTKIVFINTEKPISKRKRKQTKRSTRYHKFKIYSIHGRKIKGSKNHAFPWRWPFIDVKFFKQNLSHVWNYDFKNHHYHPKSDFYPLHLTPFMGMWLPSPHQTAKCLKRQYGDIKCKEHGYDHRLEKGVSNKADVPCTELQTSYVKITRSKFSNGTLESVYLSEKITYSVFVNTPY